MKNHHRQFHRNTQILDEQLTGAKRRERGNDPILLTIIPFLSIPIHSVRAVSRKSIGEVALSTL